MSVEFSGQITRSGCFAVPASTRLPRSSVASTWLSSTARRSANASSPSPGTLPWTAATVTSGSSADVGSHGTHRRSAGQGERPERPRSTARTGVRRNRRTAHARVVPSRATTKVAPGAPT